MSQKLASIGTHRQDYRMHSRNTHLTSWRVLLCFLEYQSDICKLFLVRNMRDRLSICYPSHIGDGEHLLGSPCVCVAFYSPSDWTQRKSAVWRPVKMAGVMEIGALC